VIIFRCPNPECHHTSRVGDEKAGDVIGCERCAWKIIVPIPTLPTPASPVAADLVDEETGAVVADWREQPPGDMATSSTQVVPGDLVQEPARPVTPLRPQQDLGELTELRCYDCGKRIRERELVRRDVATGWRSWFAGGSSSRSGWSSGGSSTHYGRVDLCRSCSRDRDEAALRQQRLAMLCGAVALAAMFLLFLFCGVLKH
jgi:hypothetical protein